MEENKEEKKKTSKKTLKQENIDENTVKKKKTEEEIKELEEYCTTNGIGAWGKYYSSEDVKPANFSESFHIRISRLCHIDR